MKFWHKLRVYFLLICYLGYDIIINIMRFTSFGPKRYESSLRLDGKVVIITGSNTGIGKETAKEFARRGAKVIVACRNIQNGKYAIEDIKKNVPTADLKLMKLDLSSFSSVRKFVQEVSKQESTLDLLINNAGVAMCPKLLTEDGFEMQMGTNHLGHFLLTLLLIDLLKRAPSARIITISSLAHAFGRINFDDFNFEKNYSPSKAYSNSKLANILFTRELAHRLSQTNIKAYCLHPGFVKTEVTRHFSIVAKAFMTIIGFMMIDPVLGSQTTLYCALDENLENESGSYYRNCTRVNNLVKNAIDDVTARKLWDLSCKLVQLDSKNILS